MESIEYIKKHNIGDQVKSKDSLTLDRGYRGVTGTIKTIAKDHLESWQYVVDLDDGRKLQCDDSQLEEDYML